jgi:hypothetical protein
MLDALPSAVGVWPWQAEPYRLWSLLDMLRFYASAFTAVMVNLARAKEFILAYPSMENVRPDLFVFLAHVYNELLETPTASTIRRQARRVMEAPDDSDTTMLYTMINELQHNITEELTSHVFLCIPDREAAPWRDPLRWFGEEAVVAFPDARGDMRDCARCLALDQWTASVYHAMCVVQHAGFTSWRTSLVRGSPEK